MSQKHKLTAEDAGLAEARVSAAGRDRLVVASTRRARAHRGMRPDRLPVVLLKIRTFQKLNEPLAKSWSSLCGFAYTRGKLRADGVRRSMIWFSCTDDLLIGAGLGSTIRFARVQLLFESGFFQATEHQPHELTNCFPGPEIYLPPADLVDCH